MITAPAAPGAPDEPLALRVGHPVRNFVLAILAIAVPLVALWWTGALMPRFHLSRARTSFNTCTRIATFAFDVSNPTPLTVTVEGARVQVVYAVAGGERSDFDGTDEDTPYPLRLAPGQHARAFVRSQISGPDAGVRAPARIQITARSPLGLTRTATDGGSLEMEFTDDGSGQECPTR